MIVRFSFLISAVLLLTGCNNKTIQPVTNVQPIRKVTTEKPFWIAEPQLHPAIQGKIYGIGSSKDHIRGDRAKRQLAISTAINEIASQKGIKVDSELEVFQTGGDKSSSAIQQYSIQTVEGKTVNAKIIDSWEDSNSKELWILMAE